MTARRARLARVIAAGTLAVGPAVVGIGSPARAAITPGFYNLIAAADTISYEEDVANVPLLAPQLLFFTPGSAQSQLDSFGDSTAYAGAPFAGQTVEGIGGLANGLGQGAIPPLPGTLPGYVATTNPSTPDQSASQGPYTLKAHSDPNLSTAQAGVAAVSGQPTTLAVNASATSSLDATTGALTAHAESIVQPFALGDILQLGTIRSTADMTVDANGKLTKSSSFDMGTISVAGIKVALTPTGLQLASGQIALPSINVLNAALSAQGISLKYLVGSATETSVTSDGLQIRVDYKVPVEGATAEVFTIGHATVSMKYGLVTADATPTITDPGAGVPTTTPTTAPVDTTVPPVATPPLPDTTGALPDVVPPATDLGTAPVTDPVIAPAQGTTADQSSPALIPLGALAAHQGPDAVRWYLLLMVAGLSLTLGSRVVGKLAIRRRVAA